MIKIDKNSYQRNKNPMFGTNNNNFLIKTRQQGFTLIELMVVVTIMLLISTAVIVDFAGQRNGRDLGIAEKELVSNIRKIQSYTLSSRTLPGSQPVQYYLIKFDISQPDRYFVQALYNVTSNPKLAEVETVRFPQGVRLDPVAPITIDRSSYTDQTPGSCALIAFKLPFGKIFANNNCAAPLAPSVISRDDYDKIIAFKANMDTDSSHISSGTVSTDSKIIIKLVDKSGTLSRTITVHGVSGTVTF